MSKSVKEILDLQNRWLENPTWDIWKTEGFEGYEFLLKPFQERWFKKWKEEKSL